MPKCSHCLIDGHTKKTCPSIDLPPTLPPEKDPPANRWTLEKEQLLIEQLNELKKRKDEESKILEEMMEE